MTANYRIEMHNLDGTGFSRTRVYDLPLGPPIKIRRLDGSEYEYDGQREYWPAVTDVPCPAQNCTGTIRWAEAG